MLTDQNAVRWPHEVRRHEQRVVPERYDHRPTSAWTADVKSRDEVAHAHAQRRQPQTNREVAEKAKQLDEPGMADLHEASLPIRRTANLSVRANRRCRSRRRDRSYKHDCRFRTSAVASRRRGDGW